MVGTDSPGRWSRVRSGGEHRECRAGSGAGRVRRFAERRPAWLFAGRPGAGGVVDGHVVVERGDLAAAFHRGEVTGGRNVPRIIVTMILDELQSRVVVGRDAFSGEVVTSAEIDRLCCDAVIHRCVADQTGAILNFGRGRRTASPQQFLALVARDRGCRQPGCDRPPQWFEAHHLRPFAARGGLTNLDEMALLCHHHHHLLHGGGGRCRATQPTSCSPPRWPPAPQSGPPTRHDERRMTITGNAVYLAYLAYLAYLVAPRGR